jgi:hypothetical protein
LWTKKSLAHDREKIVNMFVESNFYDKPFLILGGSLYVSSTSEAPIARGMTKLADGYYGLSFMSFKDGSSVEVLLPLADIGYRASSDWATIASGYATIYGQLLDSFATRFGGKTFGDFLASGYSDVGQFPGLASKLLT